MSEHAHSLVGIIELTNRSYAAPSEVDDSSLERLLASFAEHDSLADAWLHSPQGQRKPGWRRVGDDAVFDGRAKVSADLQSLVADLEQVYAALCETIR